MNANNILSFLFMFIVLCAMTPLRDELASKTPDILSDYRIAKHRAPLPPQKPFFSASTKASTQKTFDIQNVNQLTQLFEDHGYELPKKDQCKNCFSVPRLYLTSLPRDLSKKSIRAKKELFLKSLLPLILDENEKIAIERKKLLRLVAQSKSGIEFTPGQKVWLQNLKTKYKVKKGGLEELTKRVDLIPVSLALGQAAVETGWGTSFAARKKNSTFGMTIRNKVKAYEDLKSSVTGYMRNMNSNYAYREMRNARLKMRKAGKDFCSLTLAGSLKRYSELGHTYIRMVQTIIRTNDLVRFDRAQLA